MGGSRVLCGDVLALAAGDPSFRWDDGLWMTDADERVVAARDAWQIGGRRHVDAMMASVITAASRSLGDLAAAAMHKHSL
jgi:hypothetical protein